VGCRRVDGCETARPLLAVGRCLLRLRPSALRSPTNGATVAAGHLSKAQRYRRLRPRSVYRPGLPSLSSSPCPHSWRGLLSPNEFIALAEESDSISSIGRWVLREACATLKHWSEAEPAAAHLSVSVNLSVAELQDRNLVKDVAEALKRSGLAPERLHLEVTESVLSTDPEAASRALAQLRDLGVWLVIDDFGTGNSSLTALQRFPFRVLTIDRSFVGGIGIRPDDETIVTATLALAHGLCLSVVAEGVETPEQAEFLTRGGCEELQGYLFGRPGGEVA